MSAPVYFPPTNRPARSIPREPRYPEDFETLATSGPDQVISLTSMNGPSSMAAVVANGDPEGYASDTDLDLRKQRVRTARARARAKARYAAAVAADPTATKRCACGCGEELQATIRTMTGRQPIYLAGHNRRRSRPDRLCGCGCGRQLSQKAAGPYRRGHDPTAAVRSITPLNPRRRRRLGDSRPQIRKEAA